MVYIESPSTNPAFNLALEQYVFDRMDRSQEYFMLWQNDNTVVIGKNQNAFAEVNQKVADAKHISVVRRLSGGGAVYHDLGNLNFTFILDAKDATDLDIRLFCQPIAELLRSLNVPAEVNGRNDISIEGKKFSGNSQYLKQGRIMHHGTLMFHSDLSVVADVLNVSADKFQSKAAKSVKARVTNIAPYLPEGFTLAQFKALLLKYILKEENVQPYVFSAEELAEIEKIKKERLDILQDLLFSYQLKFNKESVGKVMPVLFDMKGRHKGQLIGRTPYMQNLHAELGKECLNRIINVKITDATTNSLSGVVEG